MERTDAELVEGACSGDIARFRESHTLNDNGRVMLSFAEDNTVPDSFRYAGKSVKLGTADRIVCWYKLKSTGTFRAIYGDLTVKDIAPKDLPLPVEQDDIP